MSEPQRIRVCEACGQEFVPTTSRHRFCSHRCQNRMQMRSWRKRNPLANKEAVRRWRETHKERVHRSIKEYKELQDRFWNGLGKHEPAREKDAEAFVAQEILPKLGFTNIILTRNYHGTFPVDIIADNDRQVFGIDITLSRFKHFRKGRVELLRRLGVHVLVCHLKPDYGFYQLKNLGPTSYSSTAFVGKVSIQ